jgi:hypothetical protein
MNGGNKERHGEGSVALVAGISLTGNPYYAFIGLRSEMCSTSSPTRCSE